MRTAFLSIICTLLIGGCSRPAPAPVQAADTTPNCVQIDPIAAALAQSTTHLAVGADNSYFVQETDNELDTVYRIDSLDTSHTTTLTSAAIGAAMGKPDARGNIQALAADGNTIYFYFAGEQGRESICCLGRSEPSGKIDILADNQHLSALCGIGDAISIYRAEMTPSAGTIWLWLHSVDGSIFLLIDPKNPALPAMITRPFVQPMAGVSALPLTRENYALGAGANGGMLILDYWSGILWQVSPTGFCKPLHNLTGLPSTASAPTLDADGRLAIFFAGADVFVPRDDSQTPEQIPYTEFPALLLFGDKDVKSFPVSTLLSRDQFPPANLQFGCMCPTADQSGWIAYNPAAGEFFRMKLVHRD